MRIHGAVEGLRLAAANLPQKLVTAEDAPRVAGQSIQDVKLASGQLDGLFLLKKQALTHVEAEGTDGSNRRLFLGDGPITP